MGINKKCRELNQAKNKFLEWLKDRKAQHIEVFEGGKEPDGGLDYYRHVTAFDGDTLYSGYFSMWNGIVKIDYSDENENHNDMSICDFYQLILTKKKHKP